MRTRFLSWLMAGLFLGAAGCTTFTPDENFEVALVNMTSGDVQPWETTLVFTVRLQNATPEAVTLTGGAHKIYLDGTYIGQALNDERITVPRLSDTTQSLRVRIKNFTLARKLYAASRVERISYEVRSTLYGEGGRRYRVAKQGGLDLKEFVPPSNLAPELSPGPR
jgi:LEA14-like dessication related protein